MKMDMFMGLLSKDKFKYKFMFAGGVRRICLDPGTFIYIVWYRASAPGRYLHTGG